MTDAGIEFDPPDLSGTAAVVTGGGTGIGAACAKALAGCGATVFLVGRRVAVLRSVARTLGTRGRVFPADITDGGAMERLAQAITADGFTSLHTLVNNAGILGPRDTLHNVTLAQFNEVLAVNGSGTFAVTKALLPLLIAAEPEANVVNLTSSVGRAGRAQWGPYSASKFVVESLTQTWAQELADDGVRVNALAPGLVKTDFAKVLWEGEKGDTVAEAYPLKRLGEPEDVARAALFLAAETGRWITGQTWALEGGALCAFNRVG